MSRCKKINKTGCYLGLLLSISTADVSAVSQQSWQAVSSHDPLTGQATCLMMSATRDTKDGQTSTPVSLVYNGEVFVARTKSNIDPSYPALGLQVDRKRRHDIDRILEETDAVFETNAEQIRDQFIKGRTARLTLGFWPTWPKTSSYTVDFDLRGFTRAYNEFLQCRETG